MLHSRSPTKPSRFDPYSSKRKEKMRQVGKLFNAAGHALKRLAKRIIKPCLRQKVKTPRYESAAQALPLIPTASYPNDECPAYSEVDPIHQQQSQYDSVLQDAPYQRFHQPDQVQSPQESHDHHHNQHQSESLIQEAPNTFGSDSLDGYCPVYEDPGPPDGYIITETGARIPCWWNPPQDLPPPGNHGPSH